MTADRSACHDSYSACAASAKPKVRAYYTGNGQSLDSVATRYAKRVYGSAGFDWQAGYAWCLAALMDAYHRLYGGG